jgi:hypothetical protein
VLSEIENWIEDPSMSPVFWLNGLAGTGKSTIARTIAERASASGHLGASFFCSRSFEDRSNLQLIFPTLASQLARKYPDFRSRLISLLQSNLDFIHEPLQDQMQMFLVGPLQSADISTVIVIDALDECRDENPESAILRVLGQLVSKIPRVKFFVTGRPELHITAGFRDPLLEKSTDVFVLHNVGPDTVGNDIRRFFEHELFELSRQRRIDGWPTGEDIDALCRRAAGFFVYAVATINFLNHHIKDPRKRLREIMKSPESTVHEGKAKLEGHTSLDTLYTSIFRAVFIENDDDDDSMVRSILSVVVLSMTPLSQFAIATMTGFSHSEVQRILELIQSLLVLPENPSHPVRPFHKSFPDFITDQTRCTDMRFHISPDYHTKLALCYLKLIVKALENTYPVPDDAWIEASGSRGALVYAQKSWHKHLSTTDRAMDAAGVLRLSKRLPRHARKATVVVIHRSLCDVQTSSHLLLFETLFLITGSVPFSNHSYKPPLRQLV